MISTLIAAIVLQASPVDTLVENALQVTTSQGSYVTYFNADGTYTTNVGIAGTWTVNGDQICVQRSTGESGCAPIAQDLSVGSSWQGQNAATGEMVTYTIVSR